GCCNFGCSRPEIIWGTSQWLAIGPPMQQTAAVQMRRALVTIMICLTISCGMPAAEAAGPGLLAQHAVQSEQVLKEGPWEAGLAFLQSVNKTVAGFEDYVFDSTLTAVNKGEESQDIGRMYFKRENRLRIESKSGTVNNGAVVVRTKDGRIRGAGGGML